MARKSSTIKYYTVDAFTELPLTGNPAAVCLLEEERGEKWMQSVAGEFHLSATCYVVKVVDNSTPRTNNGQVIEVPKFRLRWFAPAAELNICGHGTIASAYVLFHTGIVKGTQIEFFTKSRKLLAEKIATSKTGDDFSIRLSFPLIHVTECSSSEKELITKFTNCDSSPIKVVKMNYEDELIIEYADGKLVANLEPYIEEIRKWRGRGVIVTGAAPKDSGYDFFSRFFCPNLGMDEDPVCGSVHCGLAAYWGKKLGKSDLKAYMASSRGGTLELHLDEEKQQVFIQGKATLVMEGSLFT